MLTQTKDIYLMYNAQESGAILCIQQLTASKFKVRVFCYTFSSVSLWRPFLKDIGVAWSQELLFPSLCE
jgi:hypothetical protein